MCKCRECFGLAEYMAQLNGVDYGLPAAAGHAPIIENPCDGSLTCDCENCDRERRARVERVHEPRQPWEPRRAA